MVQPKYVAHRGFSMKAPENTLAAFELAGQSGFWGIECDTYCTVDGKWIVHHDRTVDRMTDGTGRTKDFTFEAIKKLNITSGYEWDKFPNEKIPALEEVLAVCRKFGMYAFVEIEEYHKDEDLRTLISLIEQSGMMSRCSFICFNADDLKKVRELHKTIPLGYLSDKRPSAADIELVQSLGYAFLDHQYTEVTPEDICSCHEQGIEISVWTVNTKEEAEPFIAAGADYITTDTALHKQI